MCCRTWFRRRHPTTIAPRVVIDGEIGRLRRLTLLDFAVELHNHNRVAERPTLRMINEMIRRMLLSEVVPAQ